MLRTAFEEYFLLRSPCTLAYIASSVEEEIKYDFSCFLFCIGSTETRLYLKAVLFRNWRGTENRR